MNENMFSFTFLCKFLCICNFGTCFFFRFSWNFQQNVELRNWEWYTSFWEVFAYFWNGKGQIFGPKSGLGKSLLCILMDSVLWFDAISLGCRFSKGHKFLFRNNIVFLLAIDEFILTLCILMDSSIWYYAVNLGWFIVDIEGSHVIILK